MSENIAELLEDTDPDLIRQVLWQSGQLDYKLWEQQKVIYNQVRALSDYCGEIVVMCARQFGKSFLGTLMAVEDCIKYQGYTVLVVGPTIKQTIDIVNQAMKLIEVNSPEGFIRRSKSETRWYVGESEIVVGGFDVRTATRQRGKSVLKIYVEEVVDSHPDQYRESLRSDLGPALTHSPCPQIVFLTTPPKIPDHPFITETMPEASLNGLLFKFTIDENKEITTEQYDACVRRCGGRHTVEFRREYLCEIVRDVNVMIVPDFDKLRHVRKVERDPDMIMQMAIDWGGVKDFTAALIHGYCFLRNKVFVLEERVFPPNTPSDLIMSALLDMEKGYDIKARYVDAPAQLLIDLCSKDYQVQAPSKSDWLSNVNQMCVHFSLDQIEVDPKCRLLVQTLESGTFNKGKTDFDRNKTLGHCDAIAALMYGLRMQDRTNPFSTEKEYRYGNNLYHPVRVPVEKDLALALQSKTFVEGRKKFGSFKK